MHWRPTAAPRRPGSRRSRPRPPLKIGIVSPYGYPHPGGVNEHVRHTYDAMRGLGHDVWIITRKYGRERESEGHVIRLGTGWAVPANGSVGRVTLGLRFKHQAREVLAAHRFDILHFHEPFVPFLSPTVLDQSETVNVATFHAFGGFSPVVLDREAGSPAGWRSGSTGASRSSGAARHFISRYFPGDYRIIPNGVDLDRFASAEPFEELRDGTLNILFVGRLEDRKGLIHLLQAYNRLRKRQVDARLLVVGAGPKLREYRRFVGLRGIRDVEFLGHVSAREKVRYFAWADIFCAPNTGQESFGIVLLEAMAAGVPIVASDIHGFKQVVSRNVQGLLVEPRNPRAIAAALYELAARPRAAPRMGEAGRARAPEYRWDRVTEQIVDYYYEVRDRRARRADAAAARSPQRLAVRRERLARDAKPRDSYTPSGAGRVVGVDAQAGRTVMPGRGAPPGLCDTSARARPRPRHGRRTLTPASSPRRAPGARSPRAWTVVTCAGDLVAVPADAPELGSRCPGRLEEALQSCFGPVPSGPSGRGTPPLRRARSRGSAPAAPAGARCPSGIGNSAMSSSVGATISKK